MQNNRIEWLDIAKGYGMILVIAGHCFNKGNPIHNWVFSFHMPLFFILSGYCFNPQKYKNFAQIFTGKFQSLIMPYLLFCGLGLGVSFLIPEWRCNITISSLLVDIYTGYPKTTNITSTWYLVALFILSLLLYIVLEVCKKIKWESGVYFIVILSGFFGYLITIIREMMLAKDIGGIGGGISLPGGRLPLTIDTCMTAFVFFFLGYLWRQHETKVNSTMDKKEIGVCCFVVNIIIALFLNSRVNMHGCTYGNIFLFYMGALTGVMATYSLSKKISEMDYSHWFKRFLLMYGKDSLYVLGMQSLSVHLLNYFTNTILKENYVLYENVPFAWGVIFFIIITVILMPGAIGIKRGYEKCKKIRNKKDNQI